jgi:hypothetical protein
MLTALSTGLRFRLAIALAAFAALCLVLPPAVLAMGHGADTVKCLSHADAVDHGAAMKQSISLSHSFKIQTLRHHNSPKDKDPSPASQHAPGCCGLFCMSAIVGDAGEAAVLFVTGLPQAFVRESRFLSRVPDTPDHPPKSLLSV